jgi:hypothetical protein
VKLDMLLQRDLQPALRSSGQEWDPVVCHLGVGAMAHAPRHGQQGPGARCRLGRHRPARSPGRHHARGRSRGAGRQTCRRWRRQMSPCPPVLWKQQKLKWRL